MKTFVPLVKHFNIYMQTLEAAIFALENVFFQVLSPKMF